MLITVKEVSRWLNIKPSTIYLWAAQGKIPCRRIHRVIRFEHAAIERWLSSFPSTGGHIPSSLARQDRRDVDDLIEAAKRAVYTAAHGETITPSPTREEETDGAR